MFIFAGNLKSIHQVKWDCVGFKIAMFHVHWSIEAITEFSIVLLHGGSLEITRTVPLRV